MPTPLQSTERLEPFSTAIRSATTTAHGDAEQASYLGQLLGGELPVEGYGRLVAQHLHIYRALEAATAGWAGDPEAGPFVFDELRRVPALEADLAAVYGPAWTDHIEPVPATVAYVQRLDEVATTWAGGFVAHHYVRYLGDLSGGIFIGRELDRIYDIADHAGTSFYVFDAIPDPTAFKDEYRRRLDAAPWDEQERARITEEILLGYRFNTEVLEQLS